MTQQEQELLNGLISRVNSTELAKKDADAERLLQSSLDSNSNALYILCQTVLVQQFAMDNAQRQLTEARAEVDRLKQAKPEEHGSFLGNLFGLGKGDPAQHSSTSPVPAAPAGGPGYAPVSNPGPQYGYPPQPPPGYGYGQPVAPYGSAPLGGGMFGGGGGFLQGAAQTAAGVVAGEFAFRALEDVFRGFGGGEGRGFGSGTEVVNNYYGDERGSGDGFGDRLRDADGLSGGISPDIEDRRAEGSSFFGGSDTSGSDFAGAADDSGSDLSDADDTSDFGGGNDAGFDDGGGSSDDSY